MAWRLEHCACDAPRCARLFGIDGFLYTVNARSDWNTAHLQRVADSHRMRCELNSARACCSSDISTVVHYQPAACHPLHDAEQGGHFVKLPAIESGRPEMYCSATAECPHHRGCAVEKPVVAD